MDAETAIAPANIVLICGWTAYLAYIVWDYRRWNAGLDRLTGGPHNRRGEP